MALPSFDYYAAKSLKEASELAVKFADSSVFMAGGTDVILQTPFNVAHGKDKIIDLKTIPELSRLDYVEGEGLKIGALTKLFAIQNSPAVQQHMPAVAQAAHFVASSQIRRKGTMVGNICNASPSADTAPILVVMNANVQISGQNGCRTVAMDDFFTGLKKTALKKNEGEIVTEIDIPELKSGEGSAYTKLSVRKAMDLAIIGVGVWIKMAGSKIADVRIALGGVDITTLRAKQAEQYLIGKEPIDDVLEQAGVLASQECHPISDVRASAEYRTDMVRVYVRRVIKDALAALKA